MKITQKCDLYNIGKGPVEWALSQINGIVGIAIFAIVVGVLVGLLVRAFDRSARAALLSGLIVTVLAGIMLSLLFKDPTLITNMFGGCQ